MPPLPQATFERPARWRRVLRRVLWVVVGLPLTLGLLGGGAYLHIRAYPLVLETLLRQTLMRYSLLKPVVVDGWGGLTTRVLPIDADHIAVGVTTSLVVLEARDGAYRPCAKIEGYGVVHDLALRRGILYVAAGTENLAWIDVRQPCAAQRLGHRMFGGYGFGLRVHGDRLLLANRSGGLAVFALDTQGLPSFERMLFGDAHEVDKRVAEWMTSDVVAVGQTLVAADGNKGLVTVLGAASVHPTLRTTFPEALRPGPEQRNIDPAPLRLRAHGDYIYAAMRDKGLAIFERVEADYLLRGTTAIPGEVLDLHLEQDTLFVPSTKGQVRAFDLRQDPLCLGAPQVVYDVGGEQVVHSLAYLEPYLYVSTVGTGLYQFHKEGGKPVRTWRSPDDYRGVAVVGPWVVAALGSGGVKVFSKDASGLRAVDARALPSFAFGVVALGKDAVAVCADVAGTHVFGIDQSGHLHPRFAIPTPEHCLGLAWQPGGLLGTANGVYGPLRYRLHLDAAPASFERVVGAAAPEGYTMRVGAWQGQFIGSNIAGEAQRFSDAPPGLLTPLPSRCLASATSATGDTFALACGSTLHLWRQAQGQPAAHRTLSLDRDVVAVLPTRSGLLVGGFPDRLWVYTLAGLAQQAELALNGTPYGFAADGDAFLVAAGHAGLLRLRETAGTWSASALATR